MSAKDGEIAMKPWDGIIPIEEQEAYRAAGFGRPTGIGCHPALLIIDVQNAIVANTGTPQDRAC